MNASAMKRVGTRHVVAAIGALVALSVVLAPVADAATPKNKLISRSSSGTAGDEGSGVAALSVNGRYVAFDSNATTLVGNDDNDRTDVFVRDVKKGKTRRVSVSTAGAEGNEQSLQPAISADGRFVVFQSRASTLIGSDTNGKTDVFVRDVKNGKTKRVSRRSNGSEANGSSFRASISANGRYVAFSSGADNLAKNDKNLDQDVFVHDRRTGKTTLVSKSSKGKRGNGGSGAARISANGRFVVFDSSSDNLVKNDSNDAGDIFVHDLKTKRTKRISKRSNGKQGNGNSYWPAISASGRFIAFDSDASNLVNNDDNALDDVFVHDRKTGKTRRVNVRSNGDEADEPTTEPLAISGDGRIIAFHSDATTLLKKDVNGVGDIFYHDRVTRKTRSANIAANGKQASVGPNREPAISGDGRFVAFATGALGMTLNDTNGNVEDVFRRGPIR